MQIVLSPDPTLHQVAEACDPGDESLVPLAQCMAETMYENTGVGLAAVQVGVLKRLIVVDCDVEAEERNPLFLVNPLVLETSGEPETEEEGCLSCPGIAVPITRKPRVLVSYCDLAGEQRTIEADGLLGRCLQHEIDHLEGKTLFDTCSPLDRIQALKDYEIALATGSLPGETSARVR